MANGKKVGRPRTEINQESFESLCKIQCTLEEIAGFFKCSEDTIEAWCKRTYSANFSEVYKKHSQEGKISLRRSQFRLAERNSSMAIWLGKQYLGQKDNVSIVSGDTEDDELTKSIKNTVQELVRKRSSNNEK